jgi:hypothetical protein
MTLGKSIWLTAFKNWVRKNSYVTMWHEISFAMAQQPLRSQGLPIIQPSRSQLHTPHSVGLLWTKDRPVAEASTWQYKTLRRDRHVCLLRESNPRPQQASRRPNLTPRATGYRHVTWEISGNAVTSHVTATGASVHDRGEVVTAGYRPSPLSHNLMTGVKGGDLFWG